MAHSVNDRAGSQGSKGGAANAQPEKRLPAMKTSNPGQENNSCSLQGYSFEQGYDMIAAQSGHAELAGQAACV
jgi:hypothetical protein